MASDKKAADGSVTFLNKGKRHYDTIGEAGEKLRHAPGATMTYSAEQAARMAQYKDLIDITKLPGQVNAAELRAESARLKADNEALKARLEALEPAKAEEPKEEAKEEAAAPRQRRSRE